MSVCSVDSGGWERGGGVCKGRGKVWKLCGKRESVLPREMGLKVCMFSKYLESEKPSRWQSRLTQGKELGLGQARGEKLVWRA